MPQFGTAINCMDGRVQEPVMNWLKSSYDLQYVDEITEPGPTKLITSKDPTVVDALKAKVLISVERHGSRLVALAAHGDCAGNPIPREASIRQVLEGLEVIRSWNLPVRIVGLWVDVETRQVDKVGAIEPE